MKIKDIQVIPLGYKKDYPPIQRYFGLIKVTTDSGLVGYGEASTSYGNFYPDIMSSVVDGALKRILIGKDPLDIKQRLNEMKLYLYPWLGWECVTSAVIGGIEIALWDILGKDADKPIAELLGSKLKKIPLYGTGSTFPEKDAKWHAEFFQKAIDLGFVGVKTRIASGIKKDIKQIETVRKYIGDDVKLLVDAYWSYSEASAIKITKQMEQFDVYLFEEAIPQYQLKSLARLTEQSPVPIAVGERVFTLFGFDLVVDYKAANILQPDATITCGISECLQVNALAKANNLKVLPHIGGLTAVGIAANLHVAAVIGSEMLEYDFSPFQPLRDTLIKNPLFSLENLDDGCIKVPDAPGLGIEVDEEKFEKFPFKKGKIYPDIYPQLGSGNL